jgi:hypothetical protein
MMPTYHAVRHDFRNYEGNQHSAHRCDGKVAAFAPPLRLACMWVEETHHLAAFSRAANP